MALISRLTNYLALGIPAINGVPIGEGGIINSGDTFSYIPTDEEKFICSKIFVDSMPKGRLWEAYGVIGTVNNAFSLSIGNMIAVFFAYVNYLRRELDPNTTVDLINEWEESVGLPDACSIRAGLNINERRKQVIIRWRRSPIVLASEIEKMCLFLTGFNVKVRPRRGSGLGETSLDEGALDGGSGNKFIFDVYIEFDDGAGLGKLALDSEELDAVARRPYWIECLINNLKPANSLAYFSYSKIIYDQIT